MGTILPFRSGGLQRAYRPPSRLPEASRGHGPRTRPAASVANAPLECLAGGALATRFHSWKGRSGERYICSVFPVQLEDERGGLPEFDEAIVIGVAHDALGRRRMLGVFESDASKDQMIADPSGLFASLKVSAVEWHIHLLAQDAHDRQKVIEDLTDR
jgi:hypothetical protein